MILCILCMHDFPVCLFNPAFRGCQNPINGLCKVLSRQWACVRPGRPHLFHNLPLPLRLLRRCQIILLGVNNLPTVVTQQRPTGDRTRDLLIASPVPYRCTSTPPKFFSVQYTRWAKTRGHKLLAIILSILNQFSKKYCKIL